MSHQKDSNRKYQKQQQHQRQQKKHKKQDEKEEQKNILQIVDQIFNKYDQDYSDTLNIKQFGQFIQDIKYDIKDFPQGLFNNKTSDKSSDLNLPDLTKLQYVDIFNIFGYCKYLSLKKKYQYIIDGNQIVKSLTKTVNNKTKQINEQKMNKTQTIDLQKYQNLTPEQRKYQQFCEYQLNVNSQFQLDKLDVYFLLLDIFSIDQKIIENLIKMNNNNQVNNE